jgi:protein gp37
MATTKINWAGRVWPFLKGCRRLSEGCDGCYAITQSNMRAANPNPKISAQFAGLTHREDGRLDWTGQVNYVPEHLHDPLHVLKADRWFVNSLADLFYDQVDLQIIADALAVMACCPQHVFLALTKRHGRMKAVLNDPQFILRYRAAYAKLSAELRARNPRRWGGLPEAAPWPLLNLHLGVSAENDKWFGIRVPALLDCRDAAGVLWVSAEPLIGGITATACDWAPAGLEGFAGVHNPLTGEWWPAVGDYAEEHAGRLDGLPRLDWIVGGGESGPGARECQPEWLLSLRDQCRASSVPFWMKQTGTVLARGLGLPGKGDDWDDLPPEYQVRELPALAGSRS